MAQRPINWALGIAATVVVGSLYYGERLAKASNVVVAQRAETSQVAQTPAQPRPGVRPTLAVAADYRGHYVVHPSIDNFRVKMLVDTGASIVALTAEDARNLGLKPSASDYSMSLSTANGTVRAARVMLREVRLGEIVVRNVEAVVMPPGALTMSLLGTSFLGKLQGYEVQTGRMVLRG
jgi:aspartyl protease family protein